MLLKKNNKISDFSRRVFLKKSVSAASTAIVWPTIVPSSVFGSNAPSNRINIGCIGVGNQGFTHDMPGFLQYDDVRIVAVCDVSEEWEFNGKKVGRRPAVKRVNKHYAQKSRSGSYHGCEGYNDFRKVLARDDVDAVVIVTPDHWHSIITVMAARAGKDIYCEKPLGFSVVEGRAMVEAVRRYNVILQTGSHHRSSQHIRFACELVRNGRIGKLKRAVTYLPLHSKRVPMAKRQPAAVPKGFDYDMWLGPAPKAPYYKDRCFFSFRFISDYAGGQTTNNGAHCHDIVQWANGTEHTGPVEFEDLGSQFPAKGALFDTVTKVHFRAVYANGMELICKPVAPAGPTVAARFEGTEGSIDVRYWAGLKTYPESLAKSVIGPNEVNLYRSNDHYRDFIDCVKDRRDPVAPVEVGHRSASLCHLANIAMRLKQKLFWDPHKERFKNSEQANRMLSRPMRAPWHL